MQRLSFSILGVTLLSIVISACAIPIQGKNGTIHHLIIGIGVVSTHDGGDTGVLAIKSQAVGLQVSNQPGLKFAAGYSSASVVSVPETTDNIVVEVSQRLFGPLTVEVNPECKGGEHDSAKFAGK
jgi:hypothetical protein